MRVVMEWALHHSYHILWLKQLIGQITVNEKGHEFQSVVHWGLSLMLAPTPYISLRLYLFLEREEGRDKERDRSINVWLPLVCPLLGIWLATQACALTGNQTGGPLVHRPMLNPLSHTSWGPPHHIFKKQIRSYKSKR